MCVTFHSSVNYVCRLVLLRVTYFFEVIKLVATINNAHLHKLYKPFCKRLSLYLIFSCKLDFEPSVPMCVHDKSKGIKICIVTHNYVTGPVPLELKIFMII